MLSFLSKLVIFSASFLAVSALLYFKTKVVILQQVLLLLIIILVIILRFQKPFQKKTPRQWLLLFIVTFFTQLLIASTGAIFSPFLMLIHLYVIGLSLFFNFRVALVFVGMELGLIYLNIRLDENLFNLVKQDFGSVLLYLTSILVITPISRILSQKYNIKSDTIQDLFRKLNSQEKVIEQIDDYVFITDTNLTVLSANDAAEKIIGPSPKNSLITDLVELTDEKGMRLTKEALLNSLYTITKMSATSAADKLNLIIGGYTLKLPDKKTAPKVTIRVNSMVDRKDTLEKFIFLVSRAADSEKGDTVSAKLQEAHRRYLAVWDILKSGQDTSKTTTSFYLDILKKFEQDILVTQELAAGPASLKQGMTDIFRVFAKIFEMNQKQAPQFNIEYRMNLSEGLKEEYQTSIAGNSLPEHLIQHSSVTAVTNSRLLQILLQKTLDIAAGIAYANKGTLVELGLIPSDKNIKVVFEIKLENPKKGSVGPLLEISNNRLEVLDNLALSSGLESYLIKNITELLGLSYGVNYNQYNSKLSITISLDKHS